MALSPASRLFQYLFFARIDRDEKHQITRYFMHQFRGWALKLSSGFAVGVIYSINRWCNPQMHIRIEFQESTL